MKRLALILALLLSLAQLCVASMDSLPAQRDLVDELVNPELQFSLQHSEKRIAIRQGRNLFDDVWNFISAPFKPVWGRYEEPSHRAEGPYTVFQRHKGSVPDQVQAIRNKILNKQDGFFELYAEVYKTASTGSTVNCLDQDREVMCLSVNTAKCAAFVYIIGIKYLDTDANNEINLLDSAFYLDIGARTNFSIKARDIILNAFAPGLDNRFDVNSYFIGSQNAAAYINASSGLRFPYFYYRSREALSLLQAFDMFRWANRADGSLTDESTSSTTEALAKHLKMAYIAPMYRRAIGLGFLVNHNNHTLMMASALGMAAIVLNDFGGKVFMDWENWPNRWANASNYYIHTVLWENGPLMAIFNGADGAISKGGGLYGFSEGTHYFARSFELLLPYMLAQYNYQGGDYTRSYCTYPHLLTFLPNVFHQKRMRTMFRDPDMDNMLLWYRNLVLPTGQALSLMTAR